MPIRSLLIGGGLAAVLIAAPVSAASAGPWHHHYHGCWFVGCVFDAAGAIVVGAAEIATGHCGRCNQSPRALLRPSAGIRSGARLCSWRIL